MNFDTQDQGSAVQRSSCKLHDMQCSKCAIYYILYFCCICMVLYVQKSSVNWNY